MAQYTTGDNEISLIDAYNTVSSLVDGNLNKPVVKLAYIISKLFVEIS